MTAAPGWAVGDRVAWPHREGRGSACRTVLTVGTITAVDLPGQPPGVQVTFDEPVRGLPACYATHAEIMTVSDAAAVWGPL